jgi:hypothetical protein
VIGRAVRLAAAAGALALASAQSRTWHAEREYERGVEAVDPRTGEGAIDGPTRDVPGRLESYCAAVALDPEQGIFSLRRGQIALLRAARRPAPADAAERLDEARTSLERAARLLPFDARPHDALAHVALLSGDPEQVLRRTRTAVRLAPRRKSALDTAVTRCLWVWSRTGDPEPLAAALEAQRLAFELEDGRDPEFRTTAPAAGVGRFSAALQAPDGPTLDDLRFAGRGRPALATTAARVLEPLRPADAAALRGAAGTTAP